MATISLDDHPDWVVVATFYTAIHLVEELRAHQGRGHSTGHDDRLAFVQIHHPDIHTQYQILQNASLVARYSSTADFFRDFQRELIRDRLVGEYLAAIEQYVEQAVPPSPQPSNTPS